jgi:hypothetical protein
MNSKQLVGVMALALLVPCPRVCAQKTEGPTTAAAASATERTKAEQELERKALQLLDEVIKDAQAFKIPENRLRLKAIAASMLWKYDATRARAIFRETLASIVDLLNSQEETDEPRRFREGGTQLRRDVVQMLATRDARMARDFLRATRQASTGSSGPEAEADMDLQFEYRLATQIIETDPKQALELAEDSLASGYSYELINTLRGLRQKDPESAAKLAGEIVAKLRAENPAKMQEIAVVAFNLIKLISETEAEAAGKEAKKSTPLLEGQNLRDLFEIGVNIALASPTHLQAFEGYLPLAQKYAPGRVPELRRRLAQQPKTVEPATPDDESGADWEKYGEMVEKGTAEELLAAAMKAPAGGPRQSLYQAAAMKFAEKGEPERAREIITNNVTDESLRKKMLADVERQSSLSAAEQGKLEQVRKSLAGLQTNEERALALAQIATALAGKGEKKIARQLLDEAAEMVNYRAKNAKQMGAQLMVAQAYAKLQPERSLALLEPIVDQLNELLAAATTLGAFILDEEVMRDDEIRLEIFTSVFPIFAGQYTQELQALARYDFDRTRALADRFQRDEVRMMARLLVLQTVLGDETAPGKQSRMTTTTGAATAYSEDRKDDTGGAP